MEMFLLASSGLCKRLYRADYVHTALQESLRAGRQMVHSAGVPVDLLEAHWLIFRKRQLNPIDAKKKYNKKGNLVDSLIYLCTVLRYQG